VRTVKLMHVDRNWGFGSMDFSPLLFVAKLGKD